MNWKSVGGVLAKLAPTIGAAVGGPLAGTAIASVENVLGLKPASSDLSARQDAIGAALSNATPEQLVELQKADHDFQVQMAKLGFDNVEALAALSQSDRDSARQREIAVRDWTPATLAFVVTFGFFGLLVFMCVRSVPASSKDILNILLGSLGAGWISIVSYYFGTSSAETAAKQHATLNAQKDS